MTGTSLDGVDLIYASFSDDSFKISAFEGRPFSPALKEKLKEAHSLSLDNFFLLENEYSEFIAECIEDFVRINALRPEFIGVHGQTVFHEPEKGLGYQMLNGGLIAVSTGIATVCDFRRADMAQGGQGAPLVPIGDEALFSRYDACLNLGGFANVSYRDRGHRIAFDIDVCNMLFNQLSSRENLDFDKNGAIGKTGTVISSLMEALRQLDYYKKPPPKSLGREWFETSVWPLFQKGKTEDLLRTAYEHVSYQVAASLPSRGKVLVTGGGAYNSFLIKLLREKSNAKIEIPGADLVEGKEALIFAYLAYLRVNGRLNLSSDTSGGDKDLSAGAVYLP